MITINKKELCESCFHEISEGDVCHNCGFNKADFTPDPMALPMGTKLTDKIIIGRVMGKGGFGITYLAYDLRLDKVIAVKEYFPNGISYRTGAGTELTVVDPKSAETFEQGTEKFYTEAEMVSQFNGNPNIMGVYDYFRANNTVYLVMEYLSGITLKNYVKKHGMLSDGQALYVMDKIVAALSITHSAGVLHRDISPDNIMICADGKVKLIDFGAARQIWAESSSNLTVVMKPGYTPIEQYTKKGKQGAWTDIYSLGVSIYYALTGVILDDPYSRMDNDEEFDENKHGINNSLWEILKKCTMINASDRYGSAIDLRKALRSVSAPLTAEVIKLSEDDLKQQSEGDYGEGNLSSDLGSSAIPTTAADDSPAADEIEIFEEEKEDLGSAEITDKKSKKLGKPSYAEKEKKSGNKKPLIIGAAVAAAAFITAVCIFVGLNQRPESTFTDDSSLVQQSITVDLSSSYPGDWQLQEKGIDKDTLLKFDGDIKITLDLSKIGTPYLQFRDGTSTEKLITINAINKGMDSYREGWYNLYGNAYKNFIFILSHENVEKLQNELRIGVKNVIVRSALLENYDPAEYEPKSSEPLVIDINNKQMYNDSIPISKEILQSFGGDVKVYVDIEYAELDSSSPDAIIYLVTYYPEGGRSPEIQVENNSKYPYHFYKDETAYCVGCKADSSNPNKFIFTISEEEIDNLGDIGFVFCSTNLYVKTATLEKAE